MFNKLIKRELFLQLWDEKGKREIAFIIGPRQAGKTTLMKILQNELQKKAERTLYLSLDFEHDKQYFSSQQILLNKIKLEIGKEKGFVFIDEIQRKEDAGIFLKGIYDMELPYKFIVSGSGSIDLKAKIKESMVGRKRIYELYPVSFKEFINFKTEYKFEDRLFDFFSVEKELLEQLLQEYMNFGGYPKIILENELKEKRRIINEIYQGYVEKDISYMLKVEKSEAFSLLIKVLADQIGQLVNYSEISNTLGISLPTLKNYFWYAEKTYILERITPFYRNIRSEISKSPIVYFSDIGLRNYMLGIFENLLRPDDIGFAFQNLVFSILREKTKYTNSSLHYWRTKSGAEIDFVLDLNSSVIPVEVKYKNLSRPVIPRSFENFIEKYKPEKCLIVNKNLKKRIKYKSCEVIFLTIWDLMLEEISPV